MIVCYAAIANWYSYMWDQLKNFNMPLYHAPSFSSLHYAVIILSVLQICQTPFPAWSLYICCSLGWDIISLSWSSQPLLTISLSLYVPVSEKPALKCFLIQTPDQESSPYYMLPPHTVHFFHDIHTNYNLLLWGMLI